MQNIDWISFVLGILAWRCLNQVAAFLFFSFAPEKRTQSYVWKIASPDYGPECAAKAIFNFVAGIAVYFFFS